MSDPLAVTCPLCLRADELDSMVAVPIPLHAFNPSIVMDLCRTCAFAVAKAVKKTGELPPFEEVRAE